MLSSSKLNSSQGCENEPLTRLIEINERQSVLKQENDDLSKLCIKMGDALKLSLEGKGKTTYRSKLENLAQEKTKIEDEILSLESEKKRIMGSLSESELIQYLQNRIDKQESPETNTLQNLQGEPCPVLLSSRKPPSCVSPSTNNLPMEDDLTASISPDEFHNTENLGKPSGFGFY